MQAYDEMVQNFNALMQCQTLSDFESMQERILAEGVSYAVFGPQHKGNCRRVIHDSVRLKRKKDALQECLKEMCHDGVNIFRVIVYPREDDSQKQFPVLFKNGTVNELKYCLKPNTNYEIWLSLLSRGDQNIHVYYTEYAKEEVYEEERELQQTFQGHKLAGLFFTDPDEFDVYRLTKGANNTIIAMTFGMKPITLEEIEKQFLTANPNCVAVDLQVQDYLCKCFLVPHITSKVEHFRKMAWKEDGCPFLELSTSTVNQVKVYVLCPVDCAVSLYDKEGIVTSTCQATANTCALVGTTQAMLYSAHDMQRNEFHITLLEQDFPFYATVGTPSTLEIPWESVLPAAAEDLDAMQTAPLPPISALLTELALSASNHIQTQ
jgi:hypothetical protein